MKQRLLRHALSAIGIALGLFALAPAFATSAQTDDEATGAADFGAFIAESREKQTLTRVEELELLKRQLDRGTAIRGRAYVRLLRSGLLPLSDGFEEMLTHINRVERLRRTLQRDLIERRRLAQEQRELEAGVERLRQRRAELARNLEQYERSREAILAARDREAAFQRAFESGAKPANHAAIYSAPKSPEDQAPSFAAARGQLPLPTVGRAEVRPVRLPDTLGPGVFIAVQPGEQIKAVFGGKVVLTGEYGELGRSVVIEHGAGYSTLSARLGRVLVEAGDTLEAGDLLGTLATNADGNLYFEVRHDGTALDPAEWFGL